MIPDRSSHVSQENGRPPLATGDPVASEIDLHLVGRIREGDRDALGELYDRYASIAMGIAIRIVRRREIAEDVVHDAYLAVWRRINTFDGTRGTVRSWLLVIVRNQAIDRIRATRPQTEIHEADEQSLLRTDPDQTLSAVIERASAQELRAAVGALPDEQRRAVELAFFEGHTYREIAEMHGIPLGTANGRLRLALRKLRGALLDARPDE